MMEEMSCKGFS